MSLALMGHQEQMFQFLLDKIRRNKGVDFSLYRPGTLQRRVEARLRSIGCSDYSDYLITLNKTPEEYDRLLEFLTINVTEFFRDPEMFEALKTEVIPEIIRQKQAHSQRIIRVWSAGTSDGEEAYSLSILFLELLQERVRDFHVGIYGTDVDAACVAKAKAGIYPPSSLKQVSPRLLEKYFQKMGSGFQVKERVKELTRFHLQNLTCDPLLTHLDLVLCRNVLIYFTKPLQEMVTLDFARALNPGGFLVLGKVETLWGSVSERFEMANVQERIYRTIGRGER